ncbi:MAG: hypothetical protein E7612_09045 [Ruminococcaceae bacterium]|nr:hypothetical protein [Oscillospiraceae bacterium]
MAEQRKWLVVYGEYKNQQKRAVDVITRKIADIVNYVPTVRKACALSEEDREKYCLIFVGTVENNSYIKDFASEGVINIPDNEEGYAIKVTSPDSNGKQTAIVAGGGSTGVMYGAAEFAYKHLGTVSTMTHSRALSDKGFYESGLDCKMAECEVSTSPAVRDRGLWTWGHVIYDYRKYLENMSDLRMNTVVIWNDFAPINANEIVDYAHSLGIKVIWGYSWGWNTRTTDKIDLSEEAIKAWADRIISIYENQYADTGADGIYFQSFTELDTDTKDGLLIADAVTRWVNGIVEYVFEKYSTLRLQFGVHCDSVKQHYEYLSSVHPNVEIIWENCGSFPYYYLIQVDNFEETDAYTAKIANLRGNDDKFGVVIKEMTKLDWSCFKHIEGPYVMGENSEQLKARLLEDRERRWWHMQAWWIEYAELYLKNVRTLRDVKRGDFTAVALVEDGLFECGAWSPVAMYAHGLWNPDVSENELVREVSKWSNVRFSHKS